jgi:hypothetical protein
MLLELEFLEKAITAAAVLIMHLIIRQAAAAVLVRWAGHIVVQLPAVVVLVLPHQSLAQA